MAKKVLILGNSGTGKSYSIKFFDDKEVKIISITKDELPFRSKKEIVKCPTYDKVLAEIKNTKKKAIVIDDLQYLLSNQVLSRASEKSFDKWTEFAKDYNNLLTNVADQLPADTILYFTSHTKTDDNGRATIKTAGKMIDNVVTPEGHFNIVLGCESKDGQYYFTTRTNGNDTVKTPEGMFASDKIPNNLKFVDDHIRNYYYMEGAKKDEEIAKLDKENVIELKNLEDFV